MELTPIEYKNQRVLLTKQLAEGYGTAEDKIKQNFNNNESRYISGKHYFYLQGDDLRVFPYHADEKLCRPFSPAEVMALATAATAHKTYHLTYCNHLREWIRRADAEELDGITYGAELPEDLAENMAALLGNPVE